jgi:hypothetical protein
MSLFACLFTGATERGDGSFGEQTPLLNARVILSSPLNLWKYPPTDAGCIFSGISQKVLALLANSSKFLAAADASRNALNRRLFLPSSTRILGHVGAVARAMRGSACHISAICSQYC